MNVSAALVTRGDVDLDEILDSWRPLPDQNIWNNSVQEDFRCYGRFKACQQAKHDVCLTQDDDCLVPVQELLQAYEGTMLLNIPPDENPLLGWGAVFDRREALGALGLYLHDYPCDEEFLRCADVVVTTLVPWYRVDLGHEDLLWADTPDRMFRSSGHYEERERVKAKAQALR